MCRVLADPPLPKMAQDERFIAEIVNVGNHPSEGEPRPSDATGTSVKPTGNRRFSARAQSMFRASPWVSYDPSADYRNQGQTTAAAAPSPPVPISEDVDMEAPQISTLPDDDSPPPTTSRTSKFRVKLLVNEGKSPGATPHPRKQGGKRPEGEHGDEEEEEDQLIDDYEGNSAPRVAARQPESSSKRKLNSRRKPKKADPPLEDNNAKTLSGDPSALDDGALPGEQTASSSRKRAAPRKTASKPKGKAAKSSKNLALPHLDDPANLSEGYTGTAASSPVTMPPDLPASEPERTSTPMPPFPPAEEYTSDNLPPFPIYPLPTKPFPVQPPPKISSGFAPAIPLEITKEKARHWRPAYREIRGIGGGRWFTKTWVGDKESAFASHLAAKASGAENEKQGTPTLALPKIPAIPAHVSGKPKAKLPKSQSAPSAAVSVVPSRSGSAVPEAQTPGFTQPD